MNSILYIYYISILVLISPNFFQVTQLEQRNVKIQSDLKLVKTLLVISVMAILLFLCYVCHIIFALQANIEQPVTNKCLPTSTIPTIKETVNFHKKEF